MITRFPRKLTILLAAGLTAVALTNPGAAQAASPFSEEFNGAAGAAPNGAVWNYEVGGGGWGNNEKQNYTNARANSRLDGNGNLLIEARNGANGWTSARLNTFDKFTFTYGTISARMKMPMGKGLHTGFWLLGTDIYSAGFPESGEIDIAEHINGSDFVHVGIHGPTSTGGLSTGSLDLSVLGGIFAPLAGRYTLGSDKTNIDPSQFQTYGVTKSPTRLSFLFNGTEFYSIEKSSLSAGQRWVFDKPVYVILNLAVGGDWPGAPDGNTTDSATVTVDWIRYTP